MSVTVVVRRQALPGRAEALIHAAQQRWHDPWQWERPRRHVRLYQARTHPGAVLYLSDWDSRAAYLGRASEAGAPTLDGYCTAPAKPQFFEEQAFYEDMSREALVIDAVTLTIPAVALAAARDYLAAVTTPQVRATPRLVRRSHYQSLDDPAQWLLLHGWRSREAQDHYLTMVAPRFAAAYAEMGIEVERFVGDTRADLYRVAERDSVGAHRASL